MGRKRDDSYKSNHFQGLAPWSIDGKHNDLKAFGKHYPKAFSTSWVWLSSLH